MEVYQTETHFIIVDKQHSLWCSRIDGSLQPRTGEVSLPVSALCIGMVHGVVGKFKTRADSDWKLIVIKTQRKAGCILETHDIFQINKVAIISLSGTEPTDLGLSPCPDHHGSFHKDKMAACGMHSPSNSSKPLQKTWNSVMSAVENVKPKKSFLTDLCNIVQPERDSGFQKEVKDKEKFERRIYEELLKLFNETNSFYYSLTFDLTNTVQRQSDTATAANATAANEERNNGGSGGGGKGTSAAAAAAAGVDVDVDGGAASKETAGSMGSTAAPPPPQPPSPPPLWKVADERFFWNHYLLKELLDLKDEAADHWIVPVIQGFVQDELCLMEFDINKSLTPTGTVVFDATQFRKDPLKFWLTIISRRSRHRAGTRSKKRGLEESGACANYVETEQIIQFPPHLVSFVQVRGSIPVYWSQSGFKYRPPPRLEKDIQENRSAFEKHFNEQLKIYDKISVITLVELVGKEQVIGSAFLDRILDFNSEDIIYIVFDFHEYCRGMKFENVSFLTDHIKDMIRGMRYCWVDSKGSICEQKGVFRINCVDCLDRTNVVQTAIARIVMETQCRKLGLLPPDETLPHTCRMAFQQIWANNGDAISHQYAGTAALKGDYTRTGERKFTGLMKDGVNSANRYYLRFKDDYRQAAMDVLLGQPIAEETLLSAGLQEEDVEGELLEKEENVRTLIEDLKKMLIVEPEQCLGGWSLVNADPENGENDRQEMDMILLLSQRAFYVGWYDDEREAVTQYQKVMLEDIEKIEIGLEPLLFRSKHVCMRIEYNEYEEEGFHHMFRVPNTRLFNNVVVSVKNEDDAKESLKAISHCFLATQNLVPHNFQVLEKHKLDKVKLKPHPSVIDIGKQCQETSLAAINLPRNVSECSLNDNSSDEEHGSSRYVKARNRYLASSCGATTATTTTTTTMTAAKQDRDRDRDREVSYKLGLPLRGSTLQLPKLSLHNLNPMKNVSLKGIRLPTVFYSNSDSSGKRSSEERVSIGVEAKEEEEEEEEEDREKEKDKDRDKLAGDDGGDGGGAVTEVTEISDSITGTGTAGHSVKHLPIANRCEKMMQQKQQQQQQQQQQKQKTSTTSSTTTTTTMTTTSSATARAEAGAATDVLTNQDLLDMTKDFEGSDVMFRSCGILATNPKQLLVTSLSLSSEPEDTQAALDQHHHHQQQQQQQHQQQQVMTDQSPVAGAEMHQETRPSGSSSATAMTTPATMSATAAEGTSSGVLHPQPQHHSALPTSNQEDDSSSSSCYYPTLYRERPGTGAAGTSPSSAATLNNNDDDDDDNNVAVGVGVVKRTTATTTTTEPTANPTVSEETRPKSQRRRPLCIKQSFSDGAISSLPEITGSNPDQKPVQVLLENNPLTKFTQRIQSSMARGSNSASRMAVEQMREKLRQRGECKTDVIII